MSGLWMIAALAFGMPQDGDAGVQTVEAMIACARVADDRERLRCFDAATGRVAAARDSGALIVLDRAKVIERRRQRFGLADTIDPAVGGAPIAEVETAVKQAQPASRSGLWRIEFANGQVWETTESMRYRPRSDEKVTLKTGSLGAFRARFARETVALKRLR